MLQEIINKAVELGASDIIITQWSVPYIKRHTMMQSIEEFGMISGEVFQQEVLDKLPEKIRNNYTQNKNLDFSWETQWGTRLRINIFQQRKGFAMAIRIISVHVPSFNDLNLPNVIRDFSFKKHGLLLVTGGVGSWKSTTLAALINEINIEQKKHIITIEDPIEYQHENINSLIQQREIWKQVNNFEDGLKYALRQASDVIMIGEMRDIETFRLALRAAETGNLVLATLHTSWAARTIARIVDMFPWDEKKQITSQLSESLLWIIWQDIIINTQGESYVWTEILVKNKAIENMIREWNLHQIDWAIETWKDEGMHSMKQCLESMKNEGRIDERLEFELKKRYSIN